MRTGRPPSWSKDALRGAIELYKSGSMSIKDAEMLFGIPETSFGRYVKNMGIPVSDVDNRAFKAKRNEYMRKFYLTHKDSIKKRVSLYKIRHRRQYTDNSDVVKIKLIQHYSRNNMKCATCGEQDMDILTIDHINGGGNKHRRQLSKSGTVTGVDFYRHLTNQGYPSGYQVLCWNCNAKKGINDRRNRTPLWNQWLGAT